MFSEDICRISKLAQEQYLCDIAFDSPTCHTVYEYTPHFDPGFSYYMPCRISVLGEYRIPSGFHMRARHCHMYDFLYLYGGTVIFSNSRQTLTVPENHVLLLNTDSDYTLRQTGDSPLDLLIIRNQGFISASYYNLLMRDSIHAVEIRDPGFSAYLNRLRLYMAYPTNNNSVMIAETMTRMYSAVYLEDSMNTALDQNYGYPRWFYDMIAFLEDNLHKQISIPELAKNAGVSESHFYRLFKEYTGCTPIRYLNNLRIDRARLLLRNSDTQIKSIACEVGFPNTNYFIRVFCERTGCTPMEYRNRRRPAQD